MVGERVPMDGATVVVPVLVSGLAATAFGVALVLSARSVEDHSTSSIVQGLLVVLTILNLLLVVAFGGLTVFIALGGTFGG